MGAYFVRNRQGTRYLYSTARRVPVELDRAGIDVWDRSGETAKRKGDVQLYDELGSYRAERIVYSMTAGPAWLPDDDDERSGTLVLRCCRPDPSVTPARHPDVEAWLRALAGERYELLCDWLASALDLTWPTAALYLQGPAECGKSMIAEALGRFWGAETCDYNDVVGSSFNGALMDSPVVRLEERIRPIPQLHRERSAPSDPEVQARRDPDRAPSARCLGEQRRRAGAH
jgi:hypothetical protein